MAGGHARLVGCVSVLRVLPWYEAAHVCPSVRPFGTLSLLAIRMQSWRTRLCGDAVDQRGGAWLCIAMASVRTFISNPFACVCIPHAAAQRPALLAIRTAEQQNLSNHLQSATPLIARICRCGSRPPSMPMESQRGNPDKLKAQMTRELFKDSTAPCAPLRRVSAYAPTCRTVADALTAECQRSRLVTTVPTPTALASVLLPELLERHLRCTQTRPYAVL